MEQIESREDEILVNKFKKVKVLLSKTVYDKHGTKIMEDTLEFADGTTYEYTYFKSGGTVAVAAFTDDNKMILTKQYRYPLQKVVYDIPGGAIEVGETPSQAAVRELEEETGYTTEKLEFIGKFSRGPSSQVVVDLFFARVRRKGSFNKNEIMQVEMIDLDSLLQRISGGECFDGALTIAALLVSWKKLLDR